MLHLVAPIHPSLHNELATHHSTQGRRGWRRVFFLVATMRRTWDRGTIPCQRRSFGVSSKTCRDAPLRWPNKRDYAAGDAQKRADYFVVNLVYSPMAFRRRYVRNLLFSYLPILRRIHFGHACRFRMRPHVFLRLVQAVDNVHPYSHFKYDAAGRAGLSPLQKCVTAIRILAYGVPTDAVDEYVRIGKSTARETLNHLCAAIINVFGEQYL
jgi:hypothetical protein